MTELVLHIGAPKCGSSALQVALSRSPELLGQDGTKYRYTASWPRKSKQVTWVGADVTRHAERSPFGYASWSGLRHGDDHAASMAALHHVLMKGRKGGYVPIASSESWINWPEVFAQAFADWGHPKITVVAYLRPVVDWVNAAFWQWAVWDRPAQMDAWINNNATRLYQFGTQLEAWAAIPNIDLVIQSQKPDVVRRFGLQFCVDLPMPERSNVTIAPALLGFLLRNRRFRETALGGEFEFIFQRWCPPVDGAKPLWALMPRHLRMLRDTFDTNKAALERIMSPEAYADLTRDPKWTHEKVYHKTLMAGPSDLENPADLAPLYASVVAGVAAAGGTVPQTPPPLGGDIAAWDVALGAAIDALLAADYDVRRKVGRRFGVLGF